MYIIKIHISLHLRIINQSNVRICNYLIYKIHGVREPGYSVIKVSLVSYTYIERKKSKPYFVMLLCK